MKKYILLLIILISMNLTSNHFVVNALPAHYLIPENTLSFSDRNNAFFTLIKTDKSLEIKPLEIKPKEIKPTEIIPKEIIPKEIKPKKNIISISHSPIALGFVSSSFGLRKDPIDGFTKMHKGMDIAAEHGSIVNPIGSGKVIYSGYKSGFGNLVEIKHGKTVVTRYAHLSQFLVDVGQQVDVEDTIGLVGNSGRSTGPHLHLEILFNDKQVDPKIFIASKLQSRSQYYAKINTINTRRALLNKIASQRRIASINKIASLKRAASQKRIASQKTSKAFSNLENKNITQEPMYVSADGDNIFSNEIQLDYKDYVETLNGMYGLSAPLAYR